MENQRERSKSVCKYCFGGMTLLAAVYCFVMIPIYAKTASDVVYQRTAIPDIVNFIMKMVEILCMSVGYAMTAAILSLNAKKTVGMIYITYGSAALLKCTVSQIVLWILDGGLPAINNGLLLEIVWKIVLPFVLEMIQFTLFFILVLRVWRGLGSDKDADISDIGKLYDVKRPVQKSAFCGGMIVLVTRVALTTIDEIYLTIETRPIKNLSEALTFITRYLADIIYGAAVYFAVIFVFITLIERVLHRSMCENGSDDVQSV